jgi:hypothetical protein
VRTGEKDPPLDQPHAPPLSAEHGLINTMLLLNTSVGQLNANINQLRSDVTGGGVVVTRPVSLLVVAAMLVVGIAIGWGAQAILVQRSSPHAVHFVVPPGPATIEALASP